VVVTKLKRSNPYISGQHDFSVTCTGGYYPATREGIDVFKTRVEPEAQPSTAFNYTLHTCRLVI